MTRILLLISFITIGFILKGHSQQSRITKELYEQKADSVLTARVTRKMQTLFTLTTRQQQAIKEATIALNRNRRAVYAQYGKTADLPQKMQQQDQAQDSVYQSIIGNTNYAIYKEAVGTERQQKQAAMEQRIKLKFGTIDTTINKPVVKPLNQ